MLERTSWNVTGTHIGSDPEFFTAWTLYDIGLDSKDGKRNCKTLLKVISSRGQYLLAGVDRLKGQDITDGLFGANFAGVQTVWCLKWIVGAIGQMTEESLSLEAENTNMIIKLGETVPLFGQIITSGPGTNTFFIRHDSF